MNMHPRFDTARESTPRKLTISKILADLILACQTIQDDITAEEERAGIFDRSDRRYPILARSLNERHDNLKGTIATLERRLSERELGAGMKPFP
ncbi:hypothetical protein [Bradyrhizobium septentrionale]|uniref:Uncharacterized protein n=1 Tax=Bradyrhizobium septentrionale TaxID=1404411 RepID=A0A974A3Q7_9BRAD|nr:hypothetical protein [Bradyrhizobium septentrionale]UGY15293.1 hypothetical protein HAP48_0043350 [Bradyrhizobium septentrionale]UGY23883.1 hypothetical protein HU675_0039050 [Bradyrhizobium septentrionale]